MTTMYINTNEIKRDSLMVPTGDNHDGSTMLLKFRPGKRPNTIIFGGNDLGFSVQNGDTLLIWYQFDKKKKSTTRVEYKRVLKTQPDDDLGYGINYLINKSLVSGNYVMTDSTGVISNVTFGDYSTISGFLSFKTYEVNIDLNSDINDNLDELSFDIRTKHQASFTFKITADTLKLYHTYENADSTELRIGKLKYKLVRRK